MLPKKLNLSMMQDQWASQIDPVLTNLLVNGQLLTNQTLSVGTTAINHKLGRKPLGWFLVAQMGPATVYQAATQPLPNLALSLVSDTAITTSIWVF